MANTKLMNVVNACYQLLEVLAGLALSESLVRNDQVEELAA